MPQTLTGDPAPSRALVLWRPAAVPCEVVPPANPVEVGPAEAEAELEVEAAGAGPVPGTGLALPTPPGLLLVRARQTYLTVQWAGPGDRRPPCGILRRVML